MNRSGWRGVAILAGVGLVAGTVVLPIGDAEAQVYVYPRRALKSPVRWYDFSWQYVDLLVGPDADKRRAADLGRAGPQQPGIPQPPQPGPDAVPGSPTPHPQAPTPGESAPSAPPGGGGGFPDAPLAPTADEPTTEAAAKPPTSDAPALGTKVGKAASGVAAGSPGAEASDGITAMGVPTALDPFRVDVMPLNLPPYTERRLPPLADPKKLLGSDTGGVRLYFYDREEEVAKRATALIVDAYVYLVGQFNYVPTETFPYVLYSSYQEFLQTNLFPLQEGTLGVTSPQDLKLTLPYFGDHQLFARVSSHEMAHQFTIQKVRTVTQKEELWGDPLGAMPLWFIEGLAEYYAQEGVDPEAQMLVRDIVIHPDFELGYVLLDFYEDRPYSFLWTYKMGQVRCAFLEETYGRGTIQRILGESPRLIGGVGSKVPVAGFPALLEDITGDDPRQMARKFETWLKRWAFRSYLATAQNTSEIDPLEGLAEDYIDAMTSSEDGNLLLYRAMDLTTFQSRLMLVDRRAPDAPKHVAGDGVPGVESLHPVFGRNFDVRDDKLVYVAESRGTDVLYLQNILHGAKQLTLNQVQAQNQQQQQPIAPGHPPLPPKPWERDEAWDVTLALGSIREYDLGMRGLIAAYSPAFSPDGKRVAFVGFQANGTRDVYVLDPDDSAEGGFRLTQLTRDVYSERQVAWGPDGVVFSSDATAHGYYNLFRVDPANPGKVERLTTEKRDHLDPKVLGDGRLFFTAYNRGRADLHELVDGAVARKTEVPTGVFDVGPGPEGGVWALYHEGGRRKPVMIKSTRLVTRETLEQPPPEPARKIAEQPLTNAVDYSALSARNWELGPPFAMFGAGQGGIYGQLVGSATDKLRNHGLMLNVAVLGGFEYTDGYFVYLNQERRLTWGTGLFQSLVFRADQTFPELQGLISGERFYGALGSVRYPLNQFVYLQGDVSAGGVSYFLPQFDRLILETPEANPLGQNLLRPWIEAHRGPRFQTEGTLRIGYDTIRYGGLTGPIAGTSLLLEGSTTYQPFDSEVFGTLRFDGEKYFPIFGRTHLFVRAGTGTTFGGPLARQFYLSSFDTLRGVPYGNQAFLLGRHFFFSTAELQVPLNGLIRVLILSDIEAIAGVDVGGVGQSWQHLWEHRVLAPVVGGNFALGPLILRLHFAKPINIGAPAGLPSNNGEWVTNFSIRILGFEGFFDRRYGTPGGLHRTPHTAFMGTRSGAGL